MTGPPLNWGRVLVLAPHPDDEVLGCGGVIARLADEGNPADVAIVTRGMEPDYSAESVAALSAESAAAWKLLGIRASHQLGLPAARLDQLPHSSLNAAISALIDDLQPDTLLLPFPGDIHKDHQLIFQSAMVAARPSRPAFPARILCYETVSETNWNAPGLSPAFAPTLFVDIHATLQRKIAAFGCYASQVRAFPQERSVEALRALATLRGATVHCHAAEAFVLVREVVRPLQ